MITVVLTVLASAPAAEAALEAPAPLTVGTRVHTRYRTFPQEPNHAFEVRRARLKVDFVPADWISAQLDLEVFRAPAVRDAYVSLDLYPWLRIMAGQFKKPFSRLELTNPGTLPVWSRGITNDRITDDLGYGGRDLGLMLRGRAGAVGYRFGVFNGNGTLTEIDAGKDFAARVTYRVVKNLRLGLSGSMQLRTQSGVQFAKNDIYGAGFDVRYRWQSLRLMGEVLWGEEGQTRPSRQQLGIVLLGSWELELSDIIALEPVLKLEMLDDDLRSGANQAYAITGGLNLHVTDWVRVMAQYEQTLRQSNSSVPREGTFVLVLALDYEYGIRFGDSS